MLTFFDGLRTPKQEAAALREEIAVIEPRARCLTPAGSAHANTHGRTGLISSTSRCAAHSGTTIATRQLLSITHPLGIGRVQVRHDAQNPAANKC
eukprot:scaffold1504_cov111-Isochrysis_galbana.AAC.2